MKRPARRLLVGFDGTPAAVHTLRQAVRLAGRNHGLLVVVHVVPEHPPAVAVSPLGMCAALPRDPTFATDLLRDACRLVPDQISVVRVVAAGRVGPTLAQAAERFACDTIVIGAHHGLWSRLSGGAERHLRRHAEARLIVDGARLPHRRMSRAARRVRARWFLRRPTEPNPV